MQHSGSPADAPLPPVPKILILTQESMRRADEALSRQAGQAHGPSFVEAQEREFARQASVQLSSKKSCERGGRVGVFSVALQRASLSSWPEHTRCSGPPAHADVPC